MFILDSTTDLIQIVTGSAGAIDVHASFVDLNNGAQTPQSADVAQITGATTTTAVASPAVSTQRNVKNLTIRNASATVANAITVQHVDGTNSRTATSYSQTLQPGDSIVWTDYSGWQYLPGSNTAVIPGQLLAVTVLTSSSGTFTTGNMTNKILVEAVGGGGGGGGCTSVASAASAAGGGGAGGYGQKLFSVAPATGYSYTCGSAGTANSGAAGGNGGNSTFGPVGGVTLTANGGTGGPQAVSITTLGAFAGGAGGTAGSGGDLNATGAPGEAGIVSVVATPAGYSGNGGTGLFGAGGAGLTAAGAGTAGTGNGSGGGGALTGASAARAGGAGTAGMIVVYEYS